MGWEWPALHTQLETFRRARPRPLAALDATVPSQGVPPNSKLAGMSDDQLLQAMKDYKSGKRDNAVMKALMGPLSDQDIANLAAYYASLK